jgi:hypothetical protein
VSYTFKKIKLDRFFNQYSDKIPLYMEFGKDIEKDVEEFILLSMLKYDLKYKVSLYRSKHKPQNDTFPLIFNIYSADYSKEIRIIFYFDEKKDGLYFDSFFMNNLQGNLIDFRKIKQDEKHSGFCFQEDHQIKTFSAHTALDILKQCIVLI